MNLIERQLAKVSWPDGMYYAELLPEDAAFLEARGALVEALSEEHPTRYNPDEWGCP